MTGAIIPLFWRVWLSPRRAIAALVARGITLGDWLLVAAISAVIVLIDWELTLAFGARPALYDQVADQPAILSPVWRVIAAVVSTFAVFLLNWRYGAAVCDWAAGLFGGIGKRGSAKAFLLLWLMAGYGILAFAAVVKPLIRLLPAELGRVPSWVLNWPPSAVILALSTVLGMVLAARAFAPISLARAFGMVAVLTVISLMTSTILALAMFQIGSWLNLIPAGKMA
jgi:hypothetical protein